MSWPALVYAIACAVMPVFQFLIGNVLALLLLPHPSRAERFQFLIGNVLAVNKLNPHFNPYEFQFLIGNVLA